MGASYWRLLLLSWFQSVLQTVEHLAHFVFKQPLLLFVQPVFIALGRYDQSRCGQVIADVMEIDHVARSRVFARTELLLESIDNPGCPIAHTVNTRVGS